MTQALQPRGPDEVATIESSDKSYAVAVILSGIFGMLGIQHFYLGRWGEGVLDLGLSFAWLYAFAVGQPLAAWGFFCLDLLHTVVVTYLLLVGKFKDGQGKPVTYPGQQA